MRAPILMVALVALAGTATAQETRFDGFWTTGDPNACMIGRDHVNYAFQIQNSELIGLEGSCDLTTPVAVRDMSAVLYDVACVGEGEEWSYRALLDLGIDGTLVMVTNDYAHIMQRCVAFAPGSEPRGPSAPALSK